MMATTSMIDFPATSSSVKSHCETDKEQEFIVKLRILSMTVIYSVQMMKMKNLLCILKYLETGQVNLVFILIIRSCLSSIYQASKKN